MKTKKLVAAAAVAATLCVTIGGSLAWLTDEGEVTNTFTVGAVNITLDEALVDGDGQATSGERVQENRYKLFPGKEYDKDPTVHVADDSEDCYVFVTVDNGLADIEDTNGSTIAAQIAANGWTEVGTLGGLDVYAQNDVQEAGADLIVFESFKISGSVTDLSTYGSAEIVINAYAVQAEGFDSATAAWEASFGA